MDGLNIVVEVIPVLKDMLVVWATLFLLLVLLKKLLYNPITNFINKRKEEIQSSIDNANSLNKEAEALKLDYESRIAEAKEESQRILSEARSRSEELQASIINEAREEAKSIKSRAEKDIEREKANAFESIKSETGEMAILIASKLMEQELNIDGQDQLVNKFIDEVGNAPWQN